MKILILGDARHGKDTVADMICDESNLKSMSSSKFALNTFLFDTLKEKYGLNYNSTDEAFDDRVNHRDKWFDEICIYNKKDPIKLARNLLNNADIYVGLRSSIEVEKAIKENLFNIIIGVYNYRLPRENKDSNNADVFKYSDFVIMNNGDLLDLKDNVLAVLPILKIK